MTAKLKLDLSIFNWMPDTDIIKILRSKTRLTDEEIIKLSNNKAWQIIREAEAEQRIRKEEIRKPEICFTGFNFEERENLETEAVIKGLKVTKSVTKLLAYLVIGDLPGESKIEKAQENGVRILTLDEYEKMETFEKKPKEKSKKKKESSIYEKISFTDLQRKEAEKICFSSLNEESGFDGIAIITMALMVGYSHICPDEVLAQLLTGELDIEEGILWNVQDFWDKEDDYFKQFVQLKEELNGDISKYDSFVNWPLIQEIWHECFSKFGIKIQLNKHS